MVDNLVTVWVRKRFSVISSLKKMLPRGWLSVISTIFLRKIFQYSVFVMAQANSGRYENCVNDTSAKQLAQVVYFLSFYILNIFYTIYNSIYNLRMQINFLFRVKGSLWDVGKRVELRI